MQRLVPVGRTGEALKKDTTRDMAATEGTVVSVASQGATKDITVDRRTLADSLGKFKNFK